MKLPAAMVDCTATRGCRPGCGDGDDGRRASRVSRPWGGGMGCPAHRRRVPGGRGAGRRGGSTAGAGAPGLEKGRAGGCHPPGEPAGPTDGAGGSSSSATSSGGYMSFPAHGTAHYLHSTQNPETLSNGVVLSITGLTFGPIIGI